MKKKGGVWIIVIVLAVLVLVLGAGVVYLKYWSKDCVNLNLPKIYGDSVVGFKFNYPDKTVLQDVTIEQGKSIDSVMSFKFPVADGTNLKEKWLKLTIFNQSCEKAKKKGEGTVSFAGTKFYKYENEEQTNSATYQMREYSLDRAGKCLNFEFGLRSIMMVRGQGTTVFEPNKEWVLSSDIMRTFRLIK